MKLPARIAVWMLPLLLTGCFHHKHTAQSVPLAPPVTETAHPVPAPEPAKTEPPTPAKTEPEQPTTPPESATSHNSTSNQAPRPPVHHTPKKPANSHPQIASGGGAGVSAIGQLSSGDPGASRQQTEESIASIERGLKHLNRTLNGQEQRTAAHIREFLKQARQALASGDVDGAHTLAAKARVLLNELNH